VKVSEKPQTRGEIINSNEGIRLSICSVLRQLPDFAPHLTPTFSIKTVTLQSTRISTMNTKLISNLSLLLIYISLILNATALCSVSSNVTLIDPERIDPQLAAAS